MPSRTLSFVALLTSAAFFVDLFMNWYGFGGHNVDAWVITLADFVGVVLLALGLVELVRLVDAWNGRSAELVAFFVTAGAGVMGIALAAEGRWGAEFVGGFSMWCYGAWIGLVLAIVLLGLSALRLRELTEA